MAEMTKEPLRPIIEDFRKEIQRSATTTAKPSYDVIHFRAERQRNVERPIMDVPVKLLRYRKENGRISSDVLDYEKKVGVLKESDGECQKIIQKFLEDKDPEKTAEIGAKYFSPQGMLGRFLLDGFLFF